MRAGLWLVAFAAACANAFQTSNPTSSAYTRLIAALGELDGAKLDSLSVNEEGRLVADGGGGNGGAGDLFPGDVSDAYHANTHVVLALPRSAALTAEELRTGRLAHFVDSPAFRKHLTKQKLFVPSTFIFTLFFLYQQYAGSQPHAEPVWQAWLDYHVAARTGEHSLFFWSPGELGDRREAHGRRCQRVPRAGGPALRKADAPDHGRFSALLSTREHRRARVPARSRHRERNPGAHRRP